MCLLSCRSVDLHERVFNISLVSQGRYHCPRGRQGQCMKINSHIQFSKVGKKISNQNQYNQPFLNTPKTYLQTINMNARFKKNYILCCHFSYPFPWQTRYITMQSILMFKQICHQLTTYRAFFCYRISDTNLIRQQSQ